MTQPIVIDYRYDLTPPSILGYSPSEGVTVTDPSYPITSAMQSVPGLDGDIMPGSGRIWIDGTEVTHLSTETTAFDSDGDTPQDKYWLQSLAYEPIAPLEDGWHSVMVTATDTASNIGSFSWSFIVDTTAPALSITSPATDMTTSSTTIDISGTAEPGSTVTVSGLQATVLEDGSFQYSGLPLEDGPNTITVIATDANGNSAISMRTVTHDSAIPALSGLVVSPSGVTNLGSATITGTFDEMVSLTVSGMVVPLNHDGTFMVNVLLGEGDNTIVMSAIDAAGNVFTKTDIVVTRDTIAPTLIVQLQGVDDETGEATDAEVTISGTVTDNDDVRIVSVNGLSTGYDANGHFSKDIALSFGTNEITVTAVDEAGNSVVQGFSVVWSPENVLKKQTYSTMFMLSLAIVLAAVLLVVGLLIGFLTGRRAGVPEEAYEEEMPEEEAPEEVLEEETPEEVVEEEAPEEEEALEEIEMPEEPMTEEPGEESLEEIRPPEGGEP